MAASPSCCSVLEGCALPRAGASPGQVVGKKLLLICLPCTSHQSPCWIGLPPSTQPEAEQGLGPNSALPGPSKPQQAAAACEQRPAPRCLCCERAPAPGSRTPALSCSHNSPLMIITGFPAALLFRGAGIFLVAIGAV